MDSLSHHLLLSCSPRCPFFETFAPLLFLSPEFISLSGLDSSILCERCEAHCCSARSHAVFILFSQAFIEIKKIWKYWGPLLYWVRWIRLFFFASQPQGEYCGEKKCKTEKEKFGLWLWGERGNLSLGEDSEPLSKLNSQVKVRL